MRRGRPEAGPWEFIGAVAAIADHCEFLLILGFVSGKLCIGGDFVLKKVKTFFAKETVLCVSVLCAVFTMFFVPPDGEYLHYIDWRVLCLLLSLMGVVALFQSLGAFQWLTWQLLRRIRSGRVLGVTLVLLPFFCSMAVTNDVALLVFIPFTLPLLDSLGCEKSMVPMAVLQTVAANLGSMATPVGNPQNLFLYAAYSLTPGDFFATVLPLSAVSLVCLVTAALPVLPKALPRQELKEARIESVPKLGVSGALFVLCLLTVFRLVPYPITTAVVVLALAVLDRKLIGRIDFMLLLTFVCFFTVSENLGRLEAVREFLQLLLGKNALLTAAGTSQVISNVPAAVVLSGFTEDWQSLLAGVNIGGLGTPIASLASLITLKLYMRWPGAKVGKFLGVFTAANVAGLIILLGFSIIL